MRGWAQPPPAGLHSGTGPRDTKETWPKAPSAGGQAEAGRELALPWEMKGFLEKAGPLSWLRASSLEAVGFLCFALVFGALAQVVFWGFHNPTQVEDAVLDVYDLVYEWAARNLSGTPRQQLVAIQDTNIRLVTAQCELKQGPVATGSQPGRQGPQFLCCGKSSPFGLLGDVEASLCRGQRAARQDCLQEIRSFLTTHRNVACALTGTGLALTVYAMLLSSFLWFAIRSGGSLDRKGKYTLSRRVPGCQAAEPSFFRHSQGSPKLQPPTEEDVVHSCPGARKPSGALSCSRTTGTL
ncbi:tetraspanin-32 isoform X7 [Mustela erminea]|uniref:tetraspanin-32 isoform X7 n=1 Tax=Mustela erminea TaxID=36723 RepID=UPI0013873A2A|nr:tetraspanin-32 isoform X7 [Mustela erminea]